MRKLFRALSAGRIFIVRLLLMLIIFGLPYLSTAQQKTDLSNVRIEELTDEQVRKFILELDRTGISAEQLDKIAMQNNLSPLELAKLKNRLQLTRRQLNSPARTEISSQDSLAKSERRGLQDYAALLGSLTSKNYGQDIFFNPKISFEPSLSIPTPVGYILSANDELQVEVSGVSEASYRLKVASDGNIRVPVAGPIAISGRTIEDARRLIERKLAATIYSSIRSGRTRVDVTLASIRTIKVTIIGEATVPGTYSLPSVSTLFTALYACGGPNNNGSYRDIQLIRNSKVVSTLDVYQYLSNGNKKSDLHLLDQDIIKINTYKNRIEIKGEVKRPGSYDVGTNENFEQILNYAGGFTDYAYTERIQVFRNTTRERKVTTMSGDSLSKAKPQKGDVYIIGKILNRFSNRVSIAGAVYRPGDYELTPGMTIADLIRQADGIREDAFLTRGLIHRLKDDLSPQVVPFDVEKLFKVNTEDLLLQKEDRIEIYSRFDLKEGYYVKIDGEVSSPGIFLYEEGMKVQDLILLSGGLKESSSLKRVEISRRVKDTVSQKPEDAKTAIIYQQEINADLKDSNAFSNFVLQPFDEIVIRVAPGYFVQKNVVIEGEILYTGKYTLEAKNDRISDLIKRAGGLTPSAYLKGAVLVRTRNFTATEKSNYEQGLKNLVKQNLFAGTSPTLVQAQVSDVVDKRSDFVGIDLQKIVNNPKSEYDLFLNDGDTLRIPRQLQTVRVNGEVLYPTLVRYDEELKFKDYINGAGGFGERSSKKRSYVVYPNGSVSGTKSFFFIKNYPKLSPGAEIYVPIKRERERLRTGEVITIGATLVSMLAILFSAIK